MKLVNIYKHRHVAPIVVSWDSKRVSGGVLAEVSCVIYTQGGSQGKGYGLCGGCDLCRWCGMVCGDGNCDVVIEVRQGNRDAKSMASILASMASMLASMASMASMTSIFVSMASILTSMASMLASMASILHSAFFSQTLPIFGLCTRSTCAVHLLISRMSSCAMGQKKHVQTALPVQYKHR